MDKVTHEVARVVASDVEVVAKLLARAFYRDPVLTWLLPDDTRRAQRLPRLFATMLRHDHLRAGTAEFVRDDHKVEGAALWHPPGRWRQTPWQALCSMPPLIRVFGGRMGAANRVFKLTEAEHPRQSHWYLSVIGTDPAVRRRGFGDILMRSRLSRCDSEQIGAYLESSNPDNISYYRRFGFEVMSELKLPDGGPSIWPMWREPRLR